MRSTHWLICAGVMLCGSLASAQTPEAGPLPPRTDEVSFGGQFTSGFDEAARYQRFDDPRSGATFDRVRHTQDRPAWQFNAAADHVGYRDQRYLASFERFGRVKASFEWDQIPLWYGGQAASPFRQESSGAFVVNDATQLAIQSQAATIAAYNPALQVFELRSRRDIATARFNYSINPTVGVNASFTSTGRSGAMPWSASFGFNDAVELAAPLDTRTNDFSTSAEWSNRKGMVRIGYDASFFNNEHDTLVWDNPLRATDINASEGAAHGRLPLWADSTAHTVNAAGSVALPARSRMFAYASLGSWLQDSDLLPHTINTAIAPIPLQRDTAEAEARIVSMLYRFTSRPAPALWFNGQYRLYDYDNHTPHFPVGTYVRLDGNTSTSATGGSEPFETQRHFVDLDTSITPSALRFVAFRAGYALEHADRSYRYVESTTENTVRVSVDGTGFTWGTVRLAYDHSVRTGEGLDEEVFSDIGEQVSLRQFDISDRTRDRVSAIVQFLPTNMIGLNASVSLGRDHRPDTEFGLQDNDLTGFTAGIDLSGSMGTVGFSYGFENLSTLQRSRQASPGPQFDDPTRDWATDLNEDTHTWATYLDFPRVTSRASAHFSYDYVHSNARYLYEVPSNSTLTRPSQLPRLVNSYHDLSSEVIYSFSRQISVGVGYRLDKYKVEDFGRSAQTLSTALIPAYMNLLYRWTPYDIHTGTARLIYRW